MCYPRTFAEFYQDHPHFVRRLIIKHRWAKFGDSDDLEQELLSELIRKQTVEKFNPDVYDQEVNVALFCSYLKTCVERLYATTRSKANAKFRQTNNNAMSLSEPMEDEQGRKVELIDLLDDDGRASGSAKAIAELSQMVGYIESDHPDLLPTMSAVMALQTLNAQDISDYLGVSLGHETYRVAKLLRVLRNRR